MKFAAYPALALGMALLAQAQAQTPTKVGIIHIQGAILNTKDGQKAANELQTRFAPKKAELDKKQAQISALQDQFRKGNATMSDEAKRKLMNEIDSSTKSLNREAEDAQAELNQEQGKLMQDLSGKIMAVIDKYAKDNGFALILDVSNQETSPVIWATSGIDITNDIIALYDKNAPGATSSAPATAVPKPGASTAAPKPAASTPGAPGARPAVTPPAAKKK